jgi:hypothetical protein
MCPEYSERDEVAFRKRPAGAGLQIFLESHGIAFARELHRDDE